MSGGATHLLRDPTPNRNPRRATRGAVATPHRKSDTTIRHAAASIAALKKAVLWLARSVHWQKIRRIPKLDVLTAVLCLGMLLPLVRVIFTSYSTSQPIGLWVVAVLLAVAVGLSVQSVVEKLRNPDTTH